MSVPTSRCLVVYVYKLMDLKRYNFTETSNCPPASVLSKLRLSMLVVLKTQKPTPCQPHARFHCPCLDHKPPRPRSPPAPANRRRAAPSSRLPALSRRTLRVLCLRHYSEALRPPARILRSSAFRRLRPLHLLRRL